LACHSLLARGLKSVDVQPLINKAPCFSSPRGWFLD
jgi:hypothetical protein